MGYLGNGPGVVYMPPPGKSLDYSQLNDATTAALVNAALGNQIVNGWLSVWQRGNGSFVNPAANTFLADRFQSGCVGPNATTFSRNSAAAWSSLRTVWSGGGGAGQSGFWTNLEYIGLFSATPWTLSFDAKADAPCSISTHYDVVYGGGGSAAQTLNDITIYPLTTGWVRYAHTFTGLDQSSKTYGTNPFWRMCWFMDNGTVTGLPRQAAGAVEIRNMKLEPGTIATPFVVMQPALELMNCQRYYEKSYPVAVPPGVSSGVSGSRVVAYYGVTGGWTQNGRFWVPFRVQKRAAPTVTIYSDKDGAAGFAANGGANNYAISLSTWGEVGFELTNSSGATQDGAFFNWAASSEL